MHFLRLIRFPNLLFIVLTQCLFYYGVCLQHVNNHLPSEYFWLPVLASVFIAAAGYTINDYFDVQIDAVNKPKRVVLNAYIKRRWAIVLHWTFSGIGLLLSAYLSYVLHNPLFVIANFFCITVLWFYSVTFKRKLLVGNIMVAALTGWTIMIIYFFAGGTFFPDTVSRAVQKLLLRYAIFYTAFAFITTIIREVIKDLEDIEGDRKYFCRTMPIVWGVPATKVYTAVWLSVCIAGICGVALYAITGGYWPVALYGLLLLVLPLLYMLQKLFTANAPVDYAKLSALIKMIMLAGILSMLFFFFK